MVKCENCVEHVVALLDRNVCGAPRCFCFEQLQRVVELQAGGCVRIDEGWRW